jgi:hypothetical protein
MADPIIGWKIDAADRAALLRRFPPKYERTVADHVTYGRGRHLTLPDIQLAEVVGRADDGDSLEALVVALSGSTDRPTGGTYHITWSLGPGRKPKESNDVIAAQGWEPMAESSTVRLSPSSWP